MKSLKRAIIVVSILVLIIVTIALIFIRKNSIELTGITDTETVANMEQTEGAEEYMENLVEKSDYFIVKNCMQAYCEMLNTENSAFYGYDDNDNYGKLITDEQINQMILDTLSENYISKKNITISNVRKYIKTATESLVFVPLKMENITADKDKELEDNISSYKIYGFAENSTDYTVDRQMNYIVTIDKTNLLFSIEPINSYDDEIKNYETKISKNDNNTFIYPVSTSEEIAKDYINQFKRLTLGSPETMYTFFNEEYASKRFGNVEAFKKYVEDKRTLIYSIRAAKYRENSYDDYTQYICIDQNNNYYIFNEKSALSYEAFLDPYTVDISDIADKYNAATDQNKVAMNIEKIRLAINNKDYSYVYSKLYDTFKQNYYKTETSLEEYITKNLYTNNTVKSTSVKEENGVYTASVEVTNADDETVPAKEFTVVMKLEEETTNFVMSFSEK